MASSLDSGNEELVMCNADNCPGQANDCEAVKYCRECDKFVCAMCLRTHDQWLGQAGHRLVDAYDGFRFSQGVGRLYKADAGHERNVRHATDVNDCDITDSCRLSSGKLLLVDRANEKLKVFDNHYNMERYIDIPGKPYGVCEIEASKVAVTVLESAKVQYVGFLLVNGRHDMHLGASFKVTDKCRGIAYRKGEIYVSCGGSVGEGAGHIEIYDTFGMPIRMILNGYIKIPIHIAFDSESDDNFHLFVTDSKVGAVVQLDQLGNFVQLYKDQRIREAKALCLLNDRQILVSGKRTHNVVQLNRIGSSLDAHEMLTRSNGIEHPISLVYDDRSSTLLVTMCGNKIKIFTLS